MYKGKKTLFYNGEILWEGSWLNGSPLIYNSEERKSWEVIIILPGVEVIPNETFHECSNIETVIMADTVKRIEEMAFRSCERLALIKLSRNLENIGEYTFFDCKSLTSIFVPPSCREISRWAFKACFELIILSVPQDIQLGDGMITLTALEQVSPFRTRPFYGTYYDIEAANTWIKNINTTPECELHRVCSSIHPLEGDICRIVKKKGPRSFREPNAIGITPLQYLEANPFTEIDQHKLVKRFVLEIMGEAVLL